MTELAQPLVGRDRELEVARAASRGDLRRSPRFVFITGEPGIGKTPCCSSSSDTRTSAAASRCAGSAAEFERELPFGLVVDALDEYLESLDPRDFDRLAAEDLRELAGVFPALSSLDPRIRGAHTAAERFRAHRAVRDLIERLAATQPVVLALDDLHWADGASLELDSRTCSGTLPGPGDGRGDVPHRTGRSRAVAAIERARAEVASRRIALGPLTPADARRLIDGSGPPTRERLYEASGGNPFYLLQLARRPTATTAPAPPGDGVPGAIAAAIVGELDALSAPPRRLAEAAAVAGDPFELDLACRSRGMGEADALAALDELIGHDLVRPEEVPRRFHFRHPLVRRAVYESCPPGARLAAHERSADALAARGAPAAARAHHVEHAARHGDLAAVAVLREAGEATASRAPASAARWFADRARPAARERAGRGARGAADGARARRRPRRGGSRTAARRCSRASRYARRRRAGAREPVGACAGVRAAARPSRGGAQRG